MLMKGYSRNREDFIELLVSKYIKMYPFNDKLQTEKFTKWRKNTCKYIILHHTWGGTYASNIKYLSSSPAQASVHFVVWPNWECAKIWDPAQCLRHAGQSQRWPLISMNNYSLGIEIVWCWEYNIHQFMRVTDLVEYLMWVYGIPKENVLRHADIAQRGDYSKNKELWDWKRPSRKTDVWLPFFVDNLHFKKRREQLTPRKESLYK